VGQVIVLQSLPPGGGQQAHLLAARRFQPAAGVDADRPQQAVARADQPQRAGQPQQEVQAAGFPLEQEGVERVDVRLRQAAVLARGDGGHLQVSEERGQVVDQGGVGRDDLLRLGGGQRGLVLVFLLFGRLLDLRVFGAEIEAGAVGGQDLRQVGGDVDHGLRAGGGLVVAAGDQPPVVERLGDAGRLQVGLLPLQAARPHLPDVPVQAEEHAGRHRAARPQQGLQRAALGVVQPVPGRRRCPGIEHGRHQQLEDIGHAARLQVDIPAIGDHAQHDRVIRPQSLFQVEHSPFPPCLAALPDSIMCALRGGNHWLFAVEAVKFRVA